MDAELFERVMGAGYQGSDPAVKELFARNRARFEVLVEQVKRSNVIPFIGAGFSACAYPSWSNLLLQLASGYPGCDDEVRGLIAEGRFEAAASCLQGEVCGGGDPFERVQPSNDVWLRDPFSRELERIFGGVTEDVAFSRLSPERRGIAQLFHGPVVTTNYDCMIELAYREEGREIRDLCPHGEYHRSEAFRRLRDDDSALFKIHGTIRDSNNIVLTQEDYERVYGVPGEETVLSKLLRQILTSRSVLFIGCSLESDKTVDFLKRERGFHTCFAIVEIPEEAVVESIRPDGTVVREPAITGELPGGGKYENRAFSERRKKLEGELGLQCIWYPHGEYDALDAILGKLERECASHLPRLEIPLPTYGYFGREGLSSSLVASFEAGGTIEFVTGEGGIGKTTVCIEVLRSLRDKGHVVTIVKVPQAGSERDLLDAIACALGVDQKDEEEPLDTYTGYILDVANRLRVSLVFFDGWEALWDSLDREACRHLLGTLEYLRENGISVLVSSRERLVGYETSARCRRLESLDLQSSATLFETVFERQGGILPLDDVTNTGIRAGLHGDPAYSTILRSLEGHPLAIILTATLAAQSLSWSDVAERWERAEQCARDARHDSLSTALWMSWESVADTPNAQRLWGFLSMIPGSLGLDEFDGLLNCPQSEWTNAVRRLEFASLVSVRNGFVEMLEPIKEGFFSVAPKGEVYDAFGRCSNYLFSLVLSQVEEADSLATAYLPRVDWMLYLFDKVSRECERVGLDAELLDIFRFAGFAFERDLATSRVLLNRVVDLLEKRGDYSNEAEALLALLDVEALLGSMERAEQVCMRIESLLDRLDDDDRRLSVCAALLRARASLALSGEDARVANELLGKAYAIYEGRGDRRGLAVTMYQMGQVNLSLLDVEGALKYFERSVALNSTDDYCLDVRCLAWSEYGKGLVLSDMERFDEAIDALDAAADLALRFGMRSLLALCLLLKVPFEITSGIGDGVSKLQESIDLLLADGIDARRLLADQFVQVASTMYWEAGNEFEVVRPILSFAGDLYRELDDDASASRVETYCKQLAG